MMRERGPIIAYIGLGSNLGNREEMLEAALRELDRHPDVDIVRCSSIYETDPVGYLEQPMFLNMVAEAAVRCSAERLLDICLETERRLGRERLVRWGPRTIDLDVLLYGEAEIDSEVLTVPHPRIEERLFVLIPLLEILPEHSRYFASFRSVMDTMEGKEGVRLWKKTGWPNESGLFAN
jgi:2-amino-4-hydroxy-6-hydroxymethyldihydropteridine diphosphokinase